MLKNTTYNKVKLLHELSCICWFIDKHAKNDASQAGDDEFNLILEQLKKDITVYTEKIHNLLCK